MSTKDSEPGATEVQDGPDVSAGVDDTDTTDEIDTDPFDLDTIAADVEPTTGRLTTTDTDPETTGDLDTGDTGNAADADRSGRPRRSLDFGLLAACFVIAGGLMLIAWGLITAQTGDDGVDRPDAIEDLNPVENALQVLQQESIMVDLDFGYEAELILDGIELDITRIGELDFDGLEPGQQVETPPTAVFDPGNSRIEFRPTEGAQIEELTEGRHTATVIYWRIDEGRENARSYTWSFDVI